jgi:hypothetical protein
MDIAGRREFPISGMAGDVHFSDLTLYPALPCTRTERVKRLGPHHCYALGHVRWQITTQWLDTGILEAKPMLLLTAIVLAATEKTKPQLGNNEKC